jgi:hypothetical protein
MNDLKKPLCEQKRLSAAELRKLPTDERTAILMGQAALAEDLYRRDLQLTGFEAYGEEDIRGDDPLAQEG